MSKEERVDSLKKSSLGTEFWVGVFTIAGLLCFAYLSINIGGMRVSNAGYYDVSATFGNVSGLQVGAPVEIAGVQIGEVVDVALVETDALVSLKIKEETPLRDDDIAQIRTKGIIGDKYIKISPGGSEDIIESGGELSDTESAVEFEDVLGKFIHSMESK